MSRKPILKFLILAMLVTSGCQKFSRNFNSIQTVCGVDRANDTHYVQFYAADGTRLEADDIILSGQGLLTHRGCLVVNESDSNQTLFVRHRTRSEGIQLSTRDIKQDWVLSDRQLKAYVYSPALISCVDEQLTRANILPFFQTENGLTTEAYDLRLSAELYPLLQLNSSRASLDLSGLADGRYSITGEIWERYSPEQRRYTLACTVVVDRKAPEFLTPAALIRSEDIVVSPREAISFELSEPAEDLILFGCAAKENETCEFSELKDGTWITPESGRETVLIKAQDRAGNESGTIRLNVRVYDQKKISSLQSDLARIRQLIDTQEGGAARELLSAVENTWKNLGSPEEQEPLQTALRELRLSVALSPTETTFARSEGRYINWISFDKKPALLFQKSETLVLRNELGQDLHTWALPTDEALRTEACYQNGERQLLLQSAAQSYRLIGKEFTSLPLSFDFDSIAGTGDCRYGKVLLPSNGGWQLLNFVNGETQTYSVENLWILSRSGQDTNLLSLEGGQYFIQKLDGTQRQLQESLTGFSIVRILPDGKLMARLDQKSEAHVFVWEDDRLTDVLKAPSFNLNESAASYPGEAQYLYRAKDAQWYLYDDRNPSFFRALTLSGVSSEKIALGSEIIVYNSSANQNALELKVFDNRGSLLSTFTRRPKESGTLAFKGVIGNRLLLETADGVVLLDLFPYTRLGQTRNTTASTGGMQWGPFKDAAGESWRFSRARVPTSIGEYIVEELHQGAKSRLFTQPSGMTKALQRQIERPLAVWDDRAAVILQQKTILLLQGESEQTFNIPESTDLLRLDKVQGQDDLLIVTKSGKVWRKSYSEPQSQPTLYRENVWAGCNETLSRKALVYDASAAHYLAIACQKVLEDGQSLSGFSNWEGSLLGLDMSANSQVLLVTTATQISILAKNAQTWTLLRQFKPDWGSDPIIQARLQADGKRVALASKSGRIILVPVKDEPVLEFKLSSTRPLSVDDLQLRDDRLSVLGPEGLIELPLNLP